MEIKYPATHTVHWATGLVHACERHTKQLVKLGNFLGSHVGVSVAPPGSSCVNCENENKTAPAPSGPGRQGICGIEKCGEFNTLRCFRSRGHTGDCNFAVVSGQQKEEVMDELPEVAGPYEGSLAALERRARFYIGEQLKHPSPDNALISVLSDTIRVCREFAETCADRV